VGPVLGEVTPMFPLYLGSAIVVEVLALAVSLVRRPLVFGAVAGVLIGTVGFATEWGWSHVRSTLSWGTDILFEGTLMAIAGGIAGGLLGALLAAGLRRTLPRPAVARTVLVGSLAVLAACVTNGLLATVPQVEATFGIENATDSPRTANITVQLSPADALDDPSWVQITSWQGEGLVVDALERTGEGSYRTTQPIPIHDDWKALLRLHDGRMLSAVPIYLPADAAIPADEITADDGVTRSAIPEIRILQRELTTSGGGLWLVANLVVLACTLLLIAAIAWGVARYAKRASAREPFPDVPADEPGTARADSGLGAR
jgi:hypothetical protein